MILQCSHIDKSFVGETVLSDISFHINEQEKAAIVGVNGSGKSTLIKIIMGQLSADSGDIILSKDTTVGYLAQNQEFCVLFGVCEQKVFATDLACLLYTSDAADEL